MDPSMLNPVVHYVNYLNPQDIRADSWPARRFVDYQILMVVQGEMRIELPERSEKVTVASSQLSFIAPGELNIQKLVSPAGRSMFACVHFLPSRDAGFVPDRFPARVTAGADPELFRTLFLRLYEAFQGNGQYSQPIASGIVRELFLRLLEPELSRKGGVAERVREMAAFLDVHLAEHPGRAELSRHFHLSPEYIDQLFHDCLGISPRNYVHRALAREGYRILSRENVSVKECSARLGFRNQFHFTRIFRKEYAMPPSRLG